MRTLALGYGIVGIAIGILAFTPASAGGMLFRVFENGMGDGIVYLVVGVLAALAAWRSKSSVRIYFKLAGIFFAIAALVGIFGGHNAFGIMPIDAWNTTLNTVAALLALWAGFSPSGKIVRAPVAAVALQ